MLYGCSSDTSPRAEDSVMIGMRVVSMRLWSDSPFPEYDAALPAMMRGRSAEFSSATACRTCSSVGAVATSGRYS